MGLLEFFQRSDGPEKLVTAAFLLIERDLQGSEGVLSDRHAAVRAVMESARSEFQRAKGHIGDALANRRYEPENVAWRIIYDAAYGNLVTGRFHFGRGKLNFEGKEVRKILDRALIEMKRMGMTNDEDIKALQEEIDMHILSSG